MRTDLADTNYVLDGVWPL